MWWRWPLCCIVDSIYVYDEDDPCLSSGEALYIVMNMPFMLK